ncbi:non-homologous end joining protein Ku [Streptacidiphilus rugosus]|uniref:non-homologous end joining protein Ku n=1 Tax=Streptacidiphilus rugosus TaxID=405783 RepID=UPI000689AFF8|nr:Ku protein [Streptacidiphilus rugosus]
MPASLRAAAGWSWRLLVLGVVGYAVFTLLDRFLPVVVAVFLGLVVTALLRPLADLCSAVMPRSLAVLCSFVLVVMAVGGLLTGLGFLIAHQAPQVGSQFDAGVGRLERWLEGAPWHVRPEALTGLQAKISSFVSAHRSTLLQSAVSGATQAVEVLTVVALLYTATQDHTVRFHQLQRGTGDRVRNKRVNERTGKEVDYGDIVKGYEIAPGEYLVVEPEELDQISPSRSKTIDIAGFVDLAQVEPIFFDRTYYLGPKGEEYTKIYKLLAEALERTDRAGICLFAMRGKEYLTAVRARHGLLELHTMHFADEIREPRDEIDDLPTGKTKVSTAERDTAEQLIGMLGIDWNPGQYHDTFEEQVRRLVKDKAAGREIAVSKGAPAQATNVVDLMDALKASIDTARTRREGESVAETRRRDRHLTPGRQEGPGGEEAHRNRAREPRRPDQGPAVQTRHGPRHRAPLHHDPRPARRRSEESEPDGQVARGLSAGHQTPAEPLAAQRPRSQPGRGPQTGRAVARLWRGAVGRRRGSGRWSAGVRIAVLGDGRDEAAHQISEVCHLRGEVALSAGRVEHGGVGAGWLAGGSAVVGGRQIVRHGEEAAGVGEVGGRVVDGGARAGWGAGGYLGSGCAAQCAAGLVDAVAGRCCGGWRGLPAGRRGWRGGRSGLRCRGR